MKKYKVLAAVITGALLTLTGSVMCFATTVSVPYGNTNAVSAPGQSGSNYSNTTVTYVPSTYYDHSSLYANGLGKTGVIDVSGTEYTQITTSTGSTGLTTVTVTPGSSTGIPSDTDAYNITYLSALQSYGLTVDPYTGQVVSISNSQ